LFFLYEKGALAPADFFISCATAPFDRCEGKAAGGQQQEEAMGADLPVEKIGTILQPLAPCRIWRLLYTKHPKVNREKYGSAKHWLP
jgi:hypothetical protein